MSAMPNHDSDQPMPRSENESLPYTLTPSQLGYEPAAASESESTVERPLDLDADVAQLVAMVATLRDRILNAPVGQLGVSPTGLQGDTDDNLGALLESMVSLEALVSIAGTRADRECESWQGLRSLMRATAKATTSQVHASIRAGGFASTYPCIAELWAHGDMSGAQVRHMAKVLSRVPIEYRDDAVQILADHAPGLTERELAHAARVIINAVVPGYDERDMALTERRAHLSIYPDGDGYGVTGYLTVEQATWVRTVLDAHTSVVAADDFRSFTERQAEALALVMRTYAQSESMPTLGLARAKFVVLTTAADLRAMCVDAAPGDFPFTMFGDQLDPATTRRLLSDAEITPVLAADEFTEFDEVDQSDEKTTMADVAFDAATSARLKATARLMLKRRRSREFADKGAPPVFLRLLTTPVQPLALGRSFRIVPGWLRDAVALRDQHCVVDGCDVPVHRCEIHHVQPWAAGGLTDMPNLATLCLRHHRSIDRHDWYLRPRTANDPTGRYWLATRNNPFYDSAVA